MLSVSGRDYLTADSDTPSVAVSFSYETRAVALDVLLRSPGRNKASQVLDLLVCQRTHGAFFEVAEGEVAD